MRRIKMPPQPVTTRSGFVNENGQEVLRDTGAPSASRAGQRVYAVHCRPCGHRYGVPGIDVKDRRCPRCQGGTEGETLRERQGPGLFD